MIQIDLRSREPIYEQLIANIKDLIISGLLKEDEKLPSVRELAGSLTINPNTIQKAYSILEQEGYIYTIRGKGNFVMPQEQTLSIEKAKELLEQINKLILEANYIGVRKKQLYQLIDKIYEGNKEV